MELNLEDKNNLVKRKNLSEFRASSVLDHMHSSILEGNDIFSEVRFPKCEKEVVYDDSPERPAEKTGERVVAILSYPARLKDKFKPIIDLIEEMNINED